MVHKLAPAAGNSPVAASHLIVLMEHPNRAAAARRCAGHAGAPVSGWMEFYCKRGEVQQVKGTSAMRTYLTRTSFRSSSLWAIMRTKLRICG